MSKEKEDIGKQLVPRVYHLSSDHVEFLERESVKKGIKKPEYFRACILDPFINRYKKKMAKNHNSKE